MARTRIVILGGGTGGTIVANRLRRRFDAEELEIHVVDRNNRHLYQPGLLFVPFGVVQADTLFRPRAAQLRPGIAFHQADVDHVAVERDTVTLADGTVLGYDVLVVASGARLQPDETDGLTGPGWNEKVFTFYEPESATALAGTLAGLRSGTVVVNFVDLPIKCPVAPLEFAFLADSFFRERGVRDRIDLVFATPLDSAFTKQTCAEHLGHLLERKGIGLVTDFALGEVDGAGGVATSYDGTTVDFDVLVTVPLHGGSPYVAASDGLGDALGFVRTHPRTLQAELAPNVFALGDATDVPTSKAGSVAHFEAEVVTRNIERFLAGASTEAEFDGHANCFIETGGGKALLIDFDYDVDPVPGRFGPLPLLRESRANHAGKLLFQWVYWHALLPGRDIPLPRRRIDQEVLT